MKEEKVKNTMQELPKGIKTMSKWWTKAKTTRSKKDRSGSFNFDLYLEYLEVLKTNYNSI